MQQKALWSKYEDHLVNEGLTKQTIAKQKQMFIKCERGLSKKYKESKREDIEKFVTSVNKNQFKKLDGNNFSGSTKSDIKKFLKKFYKWLKGDCETYPKEVSWISTRIRKDEKPKQKPTLTHKEVVEFANTFQKVEYRVLMLLLFDSGFRIQEMLSVKRKDLTWEDFDTGRKCFWIKCNTSKTLTRKVPIPFFTEDIQTFVNSIYGKSLRNDDLLFNMQYPNIVKQMKNVSKKVFGLTKEGKLKKKISPHALRHSSATFYAKEYEGNVPMLAQRYGWSYSAKELQTYVRESGAYQKQGAKKIFVNEVQKLRTENTELKERIEKIEKNQEKVITNLLKKHKLV